MKKNWPWLLLPLLFLVIFVYAVRSPTEKAEDYVKRELISSGQITVTRIDGVHPNPSPKYTVVSIEFQAPNDMNKWFGGRIDIKDPQKISGTRLWKINHPNEPDIFGAEGSEFAIWSGNVYLIPDGFKWHIIR